MITNYYNLNEDTTVALFLKKIGERKNVHHIILETSPKSLVDLRKLSLNIHDKNEKLKSIKETLPWTNKTQTEEHFEFLKSSGSRVIEHQEGYFDLFDGLKHILETKEDKLKRRLVHHTPQEIFALNSNDKISTARKLFIEKKVNLLPVLDNMAIIGELRPRDLLQTELYNHDVDRGNIYDHSKIAPQNSTIENIMYKRPITIPKEATLKDAIHLMIEKSLPSLIVTSGYNIYSIISYKDIFSHVEEKINNYVIDYSGLDILYEDEERIIKDFAEKTMKKISKMSPYDRLRVSMKALGNTSGTHKRKVELNLNLSYGNHTLSLKEQIIQGTSDEEFNDKIKGKWNIPKIMQKACSNLEEMVRKEKKV